MLNFEEFSAKLVETLNSYYAGSYSVAIHKVQKNNGVELNGLTIAKNGESAGVTVYMEDFYERYLMEQSMGQIVAYLVKLVPKYDLSGMNTDFLGDYKSVKSKLFFKLLNKEKNRKFMHESPYVEYLNLILIPCCLIMQENGECGLVQTRNVYLDTWGISEDQLIEDTWENACHISKCKFKSTMDIYMDYFKENLPEIPGVDIEAMAASMASHFAARNDFLIATNTMEFYGASVIAFPENLEAISQKVGGSFLVLPCSVHEVIIRPVTGRIDSKEYSDMVREINRDALDRQDVLSDSPYFYDARTKKLHLIQ